MNFALGLIGVRTGEGDVVCPIPDNASWHEVKALIRRVLSWNSATDLAERISLHTIGRQIDRISSSRDVLDTITALLRAFSRPQFREVMHATLSPIFEYHAAKIAVAAAPEPFVSSADGEAEFVTFAGRPFAALSTLSWGSPARCELDFDGDPICIRSPDGRYFVAARARLMVEFLDDFIACRTPGSQPREDYAIGVPLVLAGEVIQHLRGECHDIIQSGFAQMGRIAPYGVSDEIVHREVDASLRALTNLSRATVAALPDDFVVGEAVLRLVDSEVDQADGDHLVDVLTQVARQIDSDDEGRKKAARRLASVVDLASALVKAREAYTAASSPAPVGYDAPGI